MNSTLNGITSKVNSAIQRLHPTAQVPLTDYRLVHQTLMPFQHTIFLDYHSYDGFIFSMESFLYSYSSCKFKNYFHFVDLQKHAATFAEVSFQTCRFSVFLFASANCARKACCFSVITKLIGFVSSSLIYVSSSSHKHVISAKSGG